MIQKILDLEVEPAFSLKWITIAKECKLHLHDGSFDLLPQPYLVYLNSKDMNLTVCKRHF